MPLNYIKNMFNFWPESDTIYTCSITYKNRKQSANPRSLWKRLEKRLSTTRYSTIPQYYVGRASGVRLFDLPRFDSKRTFSDIGLLSVTSQPVTARYRLPALTNVYRNRSSLWLVIELLEMYTILIFPCNLHLFYLLECKYMGLVFRFPIWTY